MQQAPTAPLPPPICHVLQQIASELADVPRECCADRTEMLLWLRRMARRVEGVKTMRVPSPHVGQKRAGRKILKRRVGKSASARAAAEALFGINDSSHDERATHGEIRTQGQSRGTLSLRKAETRAEGDRPRTCATQTDVRHGTIEGI